MKLAVIIVSFNTKELLKKCLESVYKNSVDNFEVWVVDNASKDGSVELVKKHFPKAHIIENMENLGFSAGNNLALKKTKADYYLLLNSDTEIKKDSLEKLMEFAGKNDFGIFSCKLVNRDGSFQPNGGDLPLGLSLFSWIAGLDDVTPLLKSVLPSFHRKFLSYYKDGKEVGWVGGTAMMIREDVLKKAGYLDENIFMYGEDVEYCMRAKKKGFKIGWTDGTEIMHLGGGSSSSPKERQWIGELRGLLYIYKKYFGAFNVFILRLILYVFTFLRVIAFFIGGKGGSAKTYAKVLIHI